ncbi:protein NLP3 [Musa acuminata AAA Group]|uniref:protein NLP3 n=1 Tax=Musa acuminata AAA Group TaxID=214697 RepID=UPI0031D0DF02
MSDSGGRHSPLPPVSAALLDIELDVDGSPWPFDLSSFVASPFSPFFLSSSSCPPPPSSLSFQLPPSPLWILEDRAPEIPGALAECSRFLDGSPDTTIAKAYVLDSKARQVQIPVPEENCGSSCVIKERMTQALRYFKESTDQQALVQVWAPVKNGSRCVLTTSGQPFILDPQSTKLLQYRTVSLMYIFSVDEDDDADMGLPGRVFTKRMPEWTPNVQYYSSKEYQRLNHALLHNVQGTLALPVFEPSGHSCIGVVEIVMTSQKVNYAYEVDKVCKALEAVNLKSSEILDHPNVVIANDGRQAALAEILEILTVVCEAEKLPLAQTWVPCRHRTVLAHGGGLKKICSSFDGSCAGQVCMSTTDVAFYIIDAHLWGFREACVEHHLQKGQGVAGRAFALRRACFSRDITEYCKSDYPLVHYARMFDLAGCLAICLRSIHSGDDDYILEFFLPAECKSSAEQQSLLNSISALLTQCFQSLKVITGVEFQEGISLQLVDLVTDDNYESIPKHLSSPCDDTHKSPETNIYEAEDNDDSRNEGNATSDLDKQQVATDSNVKKNGKIPLDSTALTDNTSRTPGKRRGKAEKMISLEVLQQYFSGSLKDAAKSLGVCPTTMKRICRHHGISRWPSRKINKVNRSLSKLKHVIESVQGAGALDLASLACPLPVALDSVPWPVNLDNLKDVKDGVKERDLSPEKSRGSVDQRNKSVSLQVHVEECVHLQVEAGRDSHCSTGSSSEGSMDDTPTSQGSCQGNPVNNDIFVSNQQALSDLRQALGIGSSSKLTSQNARDQIPLNENSLPTAVNVEPQLPVGLLIKDSASSKDLKNLCTFAAEASQDERGMAVTQNTLHPWEMQENRIVIIKASYKEDIIRFRLPHSAGVLAVKDEISKRLKLEVGTFDIKYLDDDHEWVMLTCDSDLEECIEISRLSGAHIIRLSVHDIMTHHGSSCGSSEFDHHSYVPRQFNMG